MTHPTCAAHLLLLSSHGAVIIATSAAAPTFTPEYPPVLLTTISKRHSRCHSRLLGDDHARRITSSAGGTIEAVSWEETFAAQEEEEEVEITAAPLPPKPTPVPPWVMGAGFIFQHPGWT